MASLAQFFGVPVRQPTMAELLTIVASGEPPGSRLLCSAGAFLRLMEALERSADGNNLWPKSIHSAFVYGAGDAASLSELAIRLTRDNGGSLIRVAPDTEWAVSDRLPAFCKSMSGVHVAARAHSWEAVLNFRRSAERALDVVSCPAGAAFVKLEFHEVPVFLSTSDRVVDLDAELTSPQFDVRRECLSAAPVVMYITWAFEGICWQAPATSACLVIDDPLLRPRYGFLEFQHLLDLMHTHDFSTSIAFIPWNWRRSTASVVELFKKNPDRYSLAIHGCDHTGSEFGTTDIGWLAWKSKEALERMTRHASRTGIHHDPVMVFPQGVFSEAAMRVLKHGDFIGVVNTEVTSPDPQPRPVKVRDYWDVAMTSYSSFPIFTRRYPSQGIENFAFDILLGKPCIIVIHHNDCHESGKPLIAYCSFLTLQGLCATWKMSHGRTARPCERDAANGSSHSSRTSARCPTAVARREDRDGGFGTAEQPRQQPQHLHSRLLRQVCPLHSRWRRVKRSKQLQLIGRAQQPRQQPQHLHSRLLRQVCPLHSRWRRVKQPS